MKLAKQPTTVILAFVFMLCIVLFLPLNVAAVEEGPVLEQVLAAGETADSGTAGDSVTWVLDSTGTLTISGTGKMTSTPWRENYLSVIKKVVIEEGVTSIYGTAFDSCSSLAEVSIPSTVTEIGGDAFEYCAALKKVTLPEHLVTLGGWAFAHTGLTSVNLPRSLESMGSACFSSAPVEDLYLEDLEQFLSLNLESAGLRYKNLHLGGKQITDLVIPGTVTAVPANAFHSVTSLKSVTVSEGVTSIGKNAFYGCENLESVTLPGTLTAIQSGVFGKCPKLTSLTLPVGVLTINSKAFYCGEYNYTSNLTELRILGNAPLIASDAFANVTATVYYSANNASWTEDILQNYGGNITWVADDSIPATGIGSETVVIDSGSCGEALTWALDSKRTLTISGTGKMTSTPWRENYLSVIKKVVIEEGVTSIYGTAFDSCSSLAEVSIPSTVTEIGGDAFEYCAALKKVTLPENLVTLGGWAFAHTGLTSVNLPRSLESMGSACFSSAPVEDLYLEDLEQFLSLNLESAGLRYKNLHLGGKQITDLVIPGTVTAVPANAFHSVTSLKSVTVSEGVTSMGKNAFYGCENLESVTLPGTLTAIQSGVFGKCPKLTSLTLPVGVLTINSKAFYCGEYNYTSNLTELRILGNAPLIASDAFANVTATVYYSANNASWTEDILQNYGGNITWVADDSIPATGIGSETVVIDSGSCGEALTWALDSKRTLTISGTGKMTSTPWRENYLSVIKKVVIEEGVTSIYGTAFDSCSSLAEVSIPSTVTEIGGDAFEYCAALKKVTLPENLVTLGGWAFAHTGLTSVNLPRSLETMGSACFSSAPVEDLYLEDLEQFLSLNLESAGLRYKNLHLGGKQITDLVIPGTVIAVPANAFHSVTSLKSVTVSEGVTSMGKNAFYGCENLESVTLPGTLTAIQSGVFGKCPKLTSLTLPVGVLTINSKAFYCGEYNYTSNLTELRILGNAPLIASDAFANVTATVYYSANNASWTEDILQNYGGNITWVADDSIPGTGNESAIYIIASGTCGENVYWSLNSIGEFTIRGSTANPLARTVTAYTMDNYANPQDTPWYEYREYIREVVVESTVSNVGNNAFCECANLTDVTIEEGVSQIGDNAFSKCENLEEVTFQGDVPDFGANCFQEVTATVNYPEQNTTWAETDLGNTGGTIELKPVDIVHTHKYTSAVTAPTCTEDGYTTYTCSCGDSYVSDKTDALKHNFENGQCTRCGVTASGAGVTRLAGNTRYATAFTAADALKKRMGVEKFDAIIVSSGEEFADALAGSYLAAVKNAPILLVKDSTVNAVKSYIQENLNIGGTVYLLGGNVAVPQKMETGLEGFHVKRLGGNTRYDTNLMILREAGVAGKDIIVCTGKEFADSLSASAVGLPILLVKDSLNASQKEFLTGSTGKIYIVGGTNAVSQKAENQLASYGTVTRLAGNTRYQTSVLVAKTFFFTPTAVVVAYGKNFPDGLSGGPVANQMGAPLILTEPGKEKTAATYIAETGITGGYVLGGTTVLPEKCVSKVFGK